MGGAQMVPKPKVGFAKSLKNGDPSGSRTRVTGVRGQRHKRLLNSQSLVLQQLTLTVKDIATQVRGHFV